MDLTLVNFDSPTEVREFEKGRFETYRIGPMTLGRATYEPGWKWSEHVGVAAGEKLCQVEHVGNGETQMVHGVSDLVGFAQRASLEIGRPADMVGDGTDGDMEVEPG